MKFTPVGALQSGMARGLQQPIANPITLGSVAKYFFAFVPAIVTAVMGLVIILSQGDDALLGQQFVVLTGSRSVSPVSSNSFPIVVQNETAFTRFYYCMKDIGITTPTCSNYANVYEFQACMEASRKCTQPAPYAFLECLQSNFDVTLRQSIAWTDCVQLSASMMTHTVQNLDSIALFGSYNYVAFLLTALTILSSFVVFTGGGIFLDGKITLNAEKHIKSSHPLSVMFLCIAFIWNFIALFVAMGLLFNVDGVRQYPSTPWTAYAVVGMLLVTNGYFLAYFLEVYGLYYIAQVLWCCNWMYTSQRVAADGADEYSRMVADSDDQHPHAESAYHPAHQHQQLYSRQLWTMQNGQGYLSVKRWNGEFDDVENKTDSDIENFRFLATQAITPLLVVAFSWGLVLSDGLMFAGMLTPLNSVFNEDVSHVFFCIGIARIMQLSQSYFFNKAFIQNKDITPVLKKKTQFQEFGVQITALMIYIASLFQIVNVLYRMTRSYSYIHDGVFRGIFWTFIVLNGILPEVLKIIHLWYLSVTTKSNYTIRSVLWVGSFVFVWNWVCRFICGYFVAYQLPRILKDYQVDLAQLVSMAP